MRLSHCFVFMSLLGAAGCGEADGPAVDVGDTGAPTDGDDSGSGSGDDGSGSGDDGSGSGDDGSGSGDDGSGSGDDGSGSGDDGSSSGDDGSSSGDDGDTEPTTATLMGTVTRTADPQSGGIGHIYIAVFTDDPVWATDSAEVAGLALLTDVDFSGGGAEVAYEITDIEPRDGEYYLVAFLDDNGTATEADPSPDQGDLFTFETVGVPTVDLPEPGEYEVDLVLNAVMPF